MISYEFGDVVLIHFPQTGTNTRKQRPGIVMLDIGDADLVIAPVTSVTRSSAGDLRADRFEKYGSDTAIMGQVGESGDVTENRRSAKAWQIGAGRSKHARSELANTV
jgi:hypothetical protein